MAMIKKEIPNWEEALGASHRDLTQQELLNRDYYRGRVASKIGGRDVYSWEDVEIDHLL